MGLVVSAAVSGLPLIEDLEQPYPSRVSKTTQKEGGDKRKKPITTTKTPSSSLTTSNKKQILQPKTNISSRSKVAASSDNLALQFGPSLPTAAASIITQQAGFLLLLLAIMTCHDMPSHDERFLKNIKMDFMIGQLT